MVKVKIFGFKNKSRIVFFFRTVGAVIRCVNVCGSLLLELVLYAGTLSMFGCVPKFSIRLLQKIGFPRQQTFYCSI